MVSYDLIKKVTGCELWISEFFVYHYV